MPEFKRTALEVLRQPLENREVNIARAIADLDGKEAIQYRSLDIECWMGN